MNHDSISKVLTKPLVASFVVLAISIFGLEPAQGITYPIEVVNPRISFPYVAQIFISTDASESSDFLCSGTLIKADLVLTAAHCARELGKSNVDRRWVSVGSDEYFPRDSVYWSSVDSVWWNPRFSSQTLANDIGLIKLSNPVAIEVARPLKLSSKSLYDSAKSLKAFSIYGWGVDQNGDSPSVLQKANLTVQETAAKKYYKSSFNPITMIAAGGWNSTEKTYSGGCNGDSGGPLIGIFKGKPILLGVTSYISAEGCDTGHPTVFARVSYYLSDLVSGEQRVRSNAKYVNFENVMDSSVDYFNNARNGFVWENYSQEYTAPNSLGSIRTADNDCQLYVYSSESELKSDFSVTGIDVGVYAEYDKIMSLSNFWFLLRASTSDATCFVSTKSYLNWG